MQTATAPRKRAKRSVERPGDERLQEPALRVAAHDAEREEDGEDDAEEERGEHREAEDEGPGEGARVDPDRRLHAREGLERVVGFERIKPQEGGGQEEDDGEDPSSP